MSETKMEKQIITPLVDSLNLRHWEENGRRLCWMDDLEAALEKLDRYTLYKNPDDGSFELCHPNSPIRTHTARLLGVQEIKREPLKEEFILESHQNLDYSLKKFAGKKVRVTFEEIEG